jgi:Lipase maturation factor
MGGVRDYWITRFLVERGTGVICLIAFLVALNQFRPLLGDRGLLPVRSFIKHVPFRESPSLFYFFTGDIAFTTAAWAGIALSCLVISGLSARYTWSAIAVWLAIYLIYLSFVNVGQTFYSFGWESILLEACFLCMFLGSARVVPQAIPIWLFRWLLFRVMFGAGLIKLRGDSCWRDLTCLNYHYETQPMPNPLSWYFHIAPEWVNKGGVLFNHFSELIVPFFYFLPQPIAGIAGIVTIIFQLFIIASGNLSWLNWLTLFLAFSTIDARFLSRMMPLRTPEMHAPVPVAFWINAAFCAIVVWLSVPVVMNMISPRQVMNRTFNTLHLVGTYGAFGSITRPRYEVIVEGTDESVITESTKWREYQFKGKPGDVNYSPPQIAPYHLRLDWLMWFAAMSNWQDYLWFPNFMGKLLEGDRGVLGLLRVNPFPDHPPRYVRALLYEYHFTTAEEHRRTGAWWTRTLTGNYFPVVSLQTSAFQRLLEDLGGAEPQ